jgi:proteasome lid subunit RPN8/RPN11
MCSPRPSAYSRVMLTLRIPSDVREAMRQACSHAGMRETGGMLFGEHVGENEFRVAEVTVANVGRFASFVRSLTSSVLRLDRFFVRTQHNYERFNYLGEWHSHPSFELIPSGQDDATMFSIVNDPSVGARFAISVIAKLERGELHARGFAYFPPQDRDDEVQIIFEQRRS